MSPQQDTFSTRETDSAVQDCPLKKKQKGTAWIAIKLVDKKGKPVPWAEYRITTPSGDTVRGYLDDSGAARIENLQEGTCKVSFPKTDGDDWKPKA